MKICIISDLHCEIGGYPVGKSKGLEDGGDVLIVAGDLTCARYFHPGRNDAEARSQQKALRKMVDHWFEKFRRVYYVMGNHEHYGYLYRETANTMRNWLKDTNVMVLDGRHEIIEDVLFVGDTLWTNFNNGDCYDMQLAMKTMNDYNYIYKKSPDELSEEERKFYYNGRYIQALITAEFIKSEHDRMFAYIRDVLRDYKHMKTVVVTHHAPHGKSQVAARSGTLKWLYVSDLENTILQNPQIKVWAHGHTHDNVDYMVGETRVIANQRGYAGHEYSAQIFAPKFVEV